MAFPSARFAFVLALLVPLAASCDSEKPNTADRRDRPNIIVIMTDDQRAQGTMAVMPFTRGYFRDNGAVFPHAYVVDPLCCPSRASVFTGRYPHNHGVIGQLEGDDTLLDQSTTIQRHLQDAGYRTAMYGKYLNGWPLESDPPFFDDWAIFSHSDPDGYRVNRWNVNGKRPKLKTYSTTYLKRKAQRFIATSAGADPYLMFLNPAAPHKPFTPEPKYRDAVVPAAGEPTGEEDLSDKAPFMRDRPFFPQHITRVREGQLRTLMSVDDLVRGVVAAVRRSDEVRDTLIVFTSDNGYMWGENGVVGKMLPYTDSAQVPFMMAWPGRIDPGTDNRLTHNVDLTATLAEAAQVDMPTDGLSLLGDEQHEELYLEFFHVFGEPTWRSIVDRERQYIEYYDEAGEVFEFAELYDLTADPEQLDNMLAGDRGDVAAARFSKRLQRYADCRGEECVR